MESVLSSTYNMENIPPTYFTKKRHNLQQSAKKRKKEFRCSREYLISIISPLKCFYTGQSITDLNDATIDRLNCNRGYIEGNIVLACQKVNKLKGLIEEGLYVSEDDLIQHVGREAARKIIYYSHLANRRHNV